MPITIETGSEEQTDIKTTPFHREARDRPGLASHRSTTAPQRLPGVISPAYVPQDQF